jgi:ribosomal subunit interface protein
MQLQVRGKQIDVGDALRGHVNERLDNAVAKYFTQAVDANVVFSREAHLFRADIQVHAGKNIFVQSNGEADDPYVAFDLATDKIAKRLRRYKRRLTDHHKRSAEPALEAQAFVLQGAAETDGEDQEQPDEPVVVAELTEPVETLTVSDAVMRLDLGDLPALMFRNAAHGGLNMIYRRPDGNVGWVDPRGARQSQ